MADETNGRDTERSDEERSVATLHVQEFDVLGDATDITMTFRGAEVGPDGRASVVHLEIASADVESLLGALQREVARSRQPRDEDDMNSAGARQADSGSAPVTWVRHPGISYSEIGWTREQYEEAAEDMKDLEDVWNHDELDVYNDLLKG